jgi:hypothetical protein
MIHNHPRTAGVWTAEADGGPTSYYFGDQRRASEYQQFVGQHLSPLPERPEGAVWRTACTTCGILSRERTQPPASREGQ